MYIQLDWLSQDFAMSKKKLYSFRADPELLTALRIRADALGTTVSDVIHSLLSEALQIEQESTSSQYSSIRHESIKPLMEQIKREIKEELRQEMQEAA